VRHYEEMLNKQLDPGQSLEVTNLFEGVSLDRFAHPTHPVRKREYRNEGASWEPRWIR
jgi:hypothetical protein